MKTRLIFLSILCVYSIQVMMSQPTLPGQGPGGGNVEDNPINFVIYPLLLIGGYLGYIKLDNKR